MYREAMSFLRKSNRNAEEILIFLLPLLLLNKKILNFCLICNVLIWKNLFTKLRLSDNIIISQTGMVDFGDPIYSFSPT